MRARWYVAKYMEDLRRRETRNVGVILFAGGVPQVRFLGRNADGSIDSRKVAGGILVDSYKSWVSYWSELVEEEGEASEPALTRRLSDANYFVEAAGERLVGEVGDAAAFADHLFKLLVSDANESTEDAAGMGEVVSGVFRKIGIMPRVKTNEEVSITLSTGKPTMLIFDYAFQNGALHLMQRLPVLGADRRAWRATEMALFCFEKIRSSPISKSRKVNLLALYRSAESDGDEARKQVEAVRSFADDAIDFAQPDVACATLETAFGIAR